MVSQKRLRIIVTVVFLLISFPLFFSKSSYATNDKWDTLTEKICGSDKFYYETAYKEGCIAGIGITNGYCEEIYGSGAQESMSACKLGVFFSNINQHQKDRNKWITDNCGLIFSYQSRDEKIYECQGEKDWLNQQGFCIIKDSSEAICVGTFDLEAAKEEDEAALVAQEKSENSCEDNTNSVVAWIYCPQANLITQFVDWLVSVFITPFLEWRLIL